MIRFTQRTNARAIRHNVSKLVFVFVELTPLTNYFYDPLQFFQGATATLYPLPPPHTVTRENFSKL